MSIIKKDYLRKHWKGEHSLGRSFWLNNCLVNFITLLLIFALGIVSMFYTKIPMTYYIRMVLAIMVICWPIYIWQNVGLWRACKNHMSLHKRRFMPYLVKLLIVCGLALNLMHIIAWEKSTVGETFHLAFKEDPYADYKIARIDDTNLVHISGIFGFGFFDDFQLFLADNPDLKLQGVVLTSNGGRLYEARKLARFVTDNKLDTIAHIDCSSACTVALIAGEKRLINQETRVGFHAYHVSSFVNNSAFNRLNQYVDKASFRKKGISEEFLNKLFLTNSSTLWVPEFSELVHANVIHGRFNFKQYKLNSDGGEI